MSLIPDIQMMLFYIFKNEIIFHIYFTSDTSIWYAYIRSYIAKSRQQIYLQHPIGIIRGMLQF